MAGTRARSNRRLAIGLAAVVPVMVGLSFAAVPLYSWFCAVTGYGGTTSVGDGAGVAVTDRWITVSFDANTAAGMAWEFRPKQRSMRLRVGETGLAFFEARNPTDEPLGGQAGFNVVPFSVGPYFDKIQCFCFTEQVLAPGESLDMPVSFYVDPSLLDDIEARDVTDITLSYTMYPADLPEASSAGSNSTTTRLAAAPSDRATTEQ